MASRIPDAIEALIELFDSAPGLAEVEIYDGPVIAGEVADSIYVGYDGNPEGLFDAAIGDQEWAGIGAKARRESFRVVCAIVVQSGDSDIPAARARVFSIFAECETALRADPSLGLPPPTTAGVLNPQFFLEPVSGIQARLTFDVEVITRI